MPIHRIPKTKNYTVISNIVFRSGLGSGAIGLLCKVLSLHDNWKFSKSGLVSICEEGVTAVQSMLAELKEKHFLKVIKLMPSETKSGRIEYVYHFYEVPYDEWEQEHTDSSKSFKKDKPKGLHRTYKTHEDVESVDNVESVEDMNTTAVERDENVETVENNEISCTADERKSANEDIFIPTQEVAKQDTEIQGTEIRTQSNTNQTNTKKSIIKSINRSWAKIKSFQQKMTDRIDNANKQYKNRSIIEQVVKDNIEYDWYKEFFDETPDNSENVGYETFASNIEDIDMIVEVIVGTICSEKDYIRINRSNMSRSVVESRFMKLKMEHIEYALKGLVSSETKVKNPVAYLTTVLYNASITAKYAEANDLRSTDPYLFKPKYFQERQTSQYT